MAPLQPRAEVAGAPLAQPVCILYLGQASFKQATASDNHSSMGPSVHPTRMRSATGPRLTPDLAQFSSTQASSRTLTPRLCCFSTLMLSIKVFVFINIVHPGQEEPPSFQRARALDILPIKRTVKTFDL